jgi:small subunit ribosomal protein S6
MKNYEVTFIVDPVLSGDEIKQAAQTYQDMLVKEQCKIVHVERMGLRQLAYPINRRSSGVYFCIEFEAQSGHFIPKMDLSFRRDERIMRFLTVKLDRYGVKYNDDKRKGLIGKKKAEEVEVTPKIEAVKPKVETASAPAPIAKSEEE